MKIFRSDEGNGSRYLYFVLTNRWWVIITLARAAGNWGRCLLSDRWALVGLRCLPFCRKSKLLRAATTRADRHVRGKAVALLRDLWLLGMAMGPASWNGPRIARIGVHPFFCFAFFFKGLLPKKGH